MQKSKNDQGDNVISFYAIFQSNFFYIYVTFRSFLASSSLKLINCHRNFFSYRIKQKVSTCLLYTVCIDIYQIQLAVIYKIQEKNSKNFVILYYIKKLFSIIYQQHKTKQNKTTNAHRKQTKLTCPKNDYQWQMAMKLISDESFFFYFFFMSHIT